MRTKKHTNNRKDVKNIPLTRAFVGCAPKDSHLETTFSTPLERALGSAGNTISLSTKSREIMRERLVTYMEYRPIRTTVSIPQYSNTLSFQEFFTKSIARLSIRTRHFSGAALVALLLVTSTAGASFAAGSALPGDTLYPMKVGVNEEVSGLFIRSPEARATWEGDRAARRIEEVGKLAQAGELGQKENEEARSLLEKHTKDALTEVAAIEATDPARAATISNKVADTLRTREAALAQVVAETPDEADDGTTQTVLKEAQKATSVATAVAVRADKLAQMSLAEEGDTGETPLFGMGGSQESLVISTQHTPDLSEYTEKIQDADIKIRTIYQLHADVVAAYQQARGARDSVTNESVRAEVDELLLQGDMAFVAGDAARNAYTYHESYAAYRAALSIYQKVLTNIETSQTFAVPLSTIELAETIEDTVHAAKEVAEDSEGIPLPEKSAVEKKQEAARVALQEATTTIEKARVTYPNSERISSAHNTTRTLRANMLRGTAALENEDYRSAERRFTRVITESTALTTEVTRVIIPLLEQAQQTEEAGAVETTATSTVQETPHTTEKTPLVLGRVRTENTTTYYGEVAVPSECYEVRATSATGTERPEELTIALTTQEKNTSEGCAAAESTQAPFSVTLPASDTVALTHVTLNNTELPWEIRSTSE